MRLTFKALHDVVRAQAEAIREVERSTGTRVSRPEQAAALAEKVSIAELSQTFDDLSQIIDAKIDAADAVGALEAKADKGATQLALQLKADHAEVQRCLDAKADVHEVQRLFQEAEDRREASEVCRIGEREEKRGASEGEAQSRGRTRGTEERVEIGLTVVGFRIERPRKAFHEHSRPLGAHLTTLSSRSLLFRLASSPPSTRAPTTWRRRSTPASALRRRQQRRPCARLVRLRRRWPGCVRRLLLSVGRWRRRWR